MPEVDGRTNGKSNGSNGSNGKQVQWKDEPWYLKLDFQSDGVPRPNLANAIIVLEQDASFDGVLALNQFTGTLLCRKSPPWEKNEPEWTDEDDGELASWLQTRHINIQTTVVAEAARVVGRRHSFHPVRAYLEGLRWDRVPRADVWLTVYLGAEHNDYTAAVGAMWLRSAVARVYEPGCKVDHVLVLEGPQGIGKSQSLKILSKGWFSDDLRDLGRDGALQLCGHWIVELPEISHFLDRAGNPKAFLSRCVDVCRKPYGRHDQRFPRQCVFAGTTDKSTYLHDEGGSRRIWPARCVMADLDSLAQDLDQLWAEVYTQYRVGMPWWSKDPEFLSALSAEHESRFEYDVWGDTIDRFLRNQQITSIEDVLTQLKKVPGEWTIADKMRVGRHLMVRGWVRFRHREGGRLVWRYRRPS